VLLDPGYNSRGIELGKSQTEMDRLASYLAVRKGANQVFVSDSFYNCFFYKAV
jgi:hypothetical protein